MSALDLDGLREALVGEELPWVYRPDKYDDWGWLRGPVRDDVGIGPYRPIVVNARDSTIREEELNEHRAAKTDPYGRRALLVMKAVNALPQLLDRISTLEREVMQAREAHLRLCEALGIPATALAYLEVPRLLALSNTSSEGAS